MNAHSLPPTIRGAARYFGLAFPLVLLAILVLLSPRTAAESGTVRVPVVRVLLERVDAPVSLRGATRLDLFDAAGQKQLGALAAGTHTLRRAGSRIVIGALSFDAAAVRLVPSGGAQVQAFGRAYPGALMIHREGAAALLVVNLVDLESYVAGVVGHEIGFRAPAEALKSQAVAARTYAVARAKDVRAQAPQAAFDLHDDTRSQVYGGFCREQPIWQAVWATRGQVMTDRGRIFPAYYHAVCGGRTEPAESVFPKDRCPPLQGNVSCEGCRGAARYNWIATLPEWRIRSRLNAAGYTLGPIQTIVPGEATGGGRIGKLVLDFAAPPKAGSLRIGATDFRLLAGDQTIRSTRFRVVRDDAAFRFEGQGWGHGVGLCQEGTVALARAGRGADQILGFYYPGHTLAQAYEP